MNQHPKPSPTTQVFRMLDSFSSAEVQLDPVVLGRQHQTIQIEMQMDLFISDFQTLQQSSLQAEMFSVARITLFCHVA